MSESNVQLARRGYEAALRGDLEAIAGMLDPDVTWHGGDPTATDACHDRRQALEFMRRALAGGALGELVDVVDAGDKVVVIMRPPTAPDGPAGLAANVATFRDGKVVEMVHYPTADDALAAARR
jgi:ketosteroid isomerase-like protein